jgi:ABC-type transport system involved in cytochrome c biogenesis permease subunit
MIIHEVKPIQSWRPVMRRSGSLLVALSLFLTGPHCMAGEANIKARGMGPAYDQIGKLAVMHAGRVKPLDTVAREEVKHVFSRETIKLHDDANTVVETWGPVGAFVDWMVRPEFWDDQPFVLVDYLPLRQRILAGGIQSRLKEIAAKEATPANDRAELNRLAGESELTAKALSAYLKSSQLPEEYRKEITAFASRLGEEHKWLTPRELEDAKIWDKGQEISFMDWVAGLDAQKQKFDASPKSAERLTEEERRAIDVGRRLVTYKAYSGGEMRSAGIVRIMPRPFSTQALGYITKVVKKAREAANVRDLEPIEFDTLKALDTYWSDTPRDERHEPGENADFDKEFADWLRDNSVWVPLQVILKSKPEDLAASGFPESELKAFLSAYLGFVDAEQKSPGEIPVPVANALLTSSRGLGAAINPPRYPEMAAIERETHFNAMNPFWQAPIAYGAALALFALSLGFVARKASLVGMLGRTVYTLAMTCLGTGILLEVYGFYLRVCISGWAPVTNMYETVIWVALIAAVLSFVFELIYRRTFMALAGSAVALLGTITAVNVPLLDPSIHSLQPVLRSNFWLTIHVLTEVSSYAAFALAWMLGLIACGYYLTALYRRSPAYTELATPLVPGLPLLAVGSAGVAASYGVFGESWNTGDAQFYLFALMGGLGGMISLASVLAMLGEMASRRLFRQTLLAERSTNEAAEGARVEDREAATTSAASSRSAMEQGGGVATLTKPTAAQIRARGGSAWDQLDARGMAMQETAQTIKPLSNFIYRAMQVGVLLIAAGTILGGVWADYSWGRFWGWDPKEVWALITLLVYLVPLHGRFAGWVNNFGLVFSSIVCFLSVVMAWYGVNFVLGVGLHSYGFVEGGSQGFMSVILAAMLAIPCAALWRRSLGYRHVAGAA